MGLGLRVFTFRSLYYPQASPSIQTHHDHPSNIINSVPLERNTMPECIFPGPLPHPPTCPCNARDGPPPRNLKLNTLYFDAAFIILCSLDSFGDLYGLIRTSRNINMVWKAHEELIIIEIGKRIVGSHVWTEAIMIAFYQRFYDQAEQPPQTETDIYRDSEKTTNEELTPAEAKPANPTIGRADIPQLLRNMALFKESRCYLKISITPGLKKVVLSDLCPRTNCACSRAPGPVWSHTEHKRIERATYIMWYLAYGYEYMTRNLRTRPKAFLRFKAVYEECYSLRERLEVAILSRMNGDLYAKHFGAHIKNCPVIHPWQSSRFFRNWVDKVLFLYNEVSMDFADEAKLGLLDARTRAEVYTKVRERLDKSYWMYDDLQVGLNNIHLFRDEKQKEMSDLVNLYLEWVSLERVKIPDPVNPTDWMQM